MLQVFRVQLSDMRKPVTIAAVIGFNVGMYWIFAGQLSPSSAPAWGRIMRVFCPPMSAVRLPWWLVPVLNAVLYAVITIFVGFFLRLIRPFVR
jgi:hypothetical protein